MSALVKQNRIGALARATARRDSAVGGTGISNVMNLPVAELITTPGAHTLAFYGVYFFTFLLYVRPNETFPGVFGTFPLAKIVAIATPLIYLFSKMQSGEKLLIFPRELKMAYVLCLMAVLLIPIAVVAQNSIDALTESYSKVLIIFTLLINLIDTRERLRSILFLVLMLTTWLAFTSYKSYLAGEFYAVKSGIARVGGGTGGIFENPNDLATSFAMMLPIAIAFGLIKKGLKKLLYFACAACLAAAVVVTYSRGGFIGMAAAGGLLLWKLRKRNRFLPPLAAVILTLSFALMVPSGYGDRLLTSVNTQDDQTHSAQERTKVLKQAFDLAVRRSILGIGMDNFSYYSHADLKAHNSYLELAAELGAIGLIAYLIMIFRPLRALRQLEHQPGDPNDPKSTENYFLSIGLQATFQAYFVCSFFTSIQYGWFVYYPVAYAVAFRRIVEYETRGQNESETSSQDSATSAGRRRLPGTLWKPRRPLPSPALHAATESKRGWQ